MGNIPFYNFLDNIIKYVSECLLDFIKEILKTENLVFNSELELIIPRDILCLTVIFAFVISYARF